LSPTINTETAGKERNRLAKMVVLAIQEVVKQPEPNDVVKDIAAFLAFSMEAIAASIDSTVEAWEKRGYWVKADRFRLEWDWAGTYAGEIQKALDIEDWGALALIVAKIGKKLGNIRIAKKNRMGTPWIGSWQRYKNKQSRN